MEVTTREGVLVEGAAPRLVPGEWHAVRLAVAGGALSGWLDGAALFSGLALGGRVPPAGFAGFGTLDWGQFVDFANFSVVGA